MAVERPPQGNTTNMRDLLELKRADNLITLKKVLLSDILPILIGAIVILAINVGIILLIGLAGRPGFAYEDGLYGMQSQAVIGIPIVNLITTLGAAIMLTRSLGVFAWIAFAVSILFFSHVHYDAILSAVFYGSILPYLVGIICIILVTRFYEAIQLRRFPTKLISIPATLVYILLAASFIAISVIHRQ